jgi:hypothetical protein
MSALVSRSETRAPAETRSFTSKVTVPVTPTSVPPEVCSFSVQVPRAGAVPRSKKSSTEPSA